MKKLIVAFILLLFAVWVGFLIHRDPGYILITYHSWSVETSLWVGIVILLIAFIVFYALLRIFRHTARLGTNLQLWNKVRRERKAGELTNQAFDALIAMQWKSAEDLFSKSAKNSTCPVINYSMAAYAAQQLTAFDRRNRYLSKLSKQANSADKTAKLIESYFYIHSDQWKEALNSLRLLQKKYPDDPAILRFLAKGLAGLKDWDALKDMLPQLQKHCDNKEYQRLEEKVYTQLLEKAIHPEWLDQAWNAVPKTTRLNVRIVITYAKKAAELRRDNEAIHAVENVLKKTWSNDLVDVYGRLHSNHINKQISHAESWLKKHPNDPSLLVCLGRLCIHEKLWGKASDYLNKALQLATTPDVYAELGHLFEATDDPKAALEHYRKACS